MAFISSASAATGGAGHLGTAMCEALAELGAYIVIGSRDKEKCKTYIQNAQLNKK